jgi:DNA-binding winged helix-turn-helix (wHTH) protein
MVKKDKHLRHFGTFTLDIDERLLSNDGVPVPLTPKAFDILAVLVTNSGHLVEKDDLLKEVWGDTAVEEGSIAWNISQLRKSLGDSAAKPRYIKTVSKSGYRFIASVQRTTIGVSNSVFEKDKEDTDADGSAGAVYKEAPAAVNLSGKVADIKEFFREYSYHVVVGCFLYAVLYIVALFIEVAYQFDRLGAFALLSAPLVFFWIFGTAVFGLWLDWKLARQGKGIGLSISIAVFIGAALLLYAFIGQFLPNAPITVASFQTYTAQGAYLKSVYYFLPLAIVFLILPFHLIVSLRREIKIGHPSLVGKLLMNKRSSVKPEGAIYLRVGWLVIILFCAAIAAFVATAHLLENLKPNPYFNLFTQLVQWRLLLYFLLGAECLTWYSQTLNEIKRECFKVMRI